MRCLSGLCIYHIRCHIIIKSPVQPGRSRKSQVQLRWTTLTPCYAQVYHFNSHFTTIISKMTIFLQPIPNKIPSFPSHQALNCHYTQPFELIRYLPYQKYQTFKCGITLTNIIFQLSSQAKNKKTHKTLSKSPWPILQKSQSHFLFFC